MPIPVSDRFWPKVAKGSADECWYWCGYTDKDGYGKIWGGPANPTQLSAHRVSYTLRYGDLPEGVVVMHTCDIPSCVNPEHLALGTTQTNVDDKVAKSRQAFGERIATAKLTDEAVRFIRSEAGVSARALARLLGVSKSVVSDVRNGVTWKHVA